MPEFRRRHPEGVEVVLERGEASLLAGLPDQLKELIGIGKGLVHDRLFPRAYLDPTEEEAESEWQRLMHDELMRSKISAAEAFAATLAGARPASGDRVIAELGAEEVACWLGTLNDVRLALGVMLEVTEDLDLAGIDPEDPRAPGLHLYGFLTWVQGELVDAVNP